jgi:pilus assembly protein CpaC
MKVLPLIMLLVVSLSTAAAETPLPEEIRISLGESMLIMADIKRAALGSGKVVSIATPERGQLMLFGEAAGQTTAQLWLRDGSVHSMRIIVTEQDLAARLAQVRGLLSGLQHISARISGGYVIVEGDRAGAEELKRASEVVALFPGQVLDFTGKAGWESMVQMQVRVIEVRRDKLKQLGLNWTTDAAGPEISIVAGGAGKQGVRAAMATILESRLDILQQRGFAYAVAEPVLSCRSGGLARFISGGEIPIPITDGLGSTDVQYKEYGVILEVRPRTGRDGAVYADIDIEMSQVDSSVRAGDYPGFVKRRTSTAFNAQTGETIAISGLVSRERSRDRSGLPGLSSVPGLGALFRTSRRQERETELLILITPRIFEAGVSGPPAPALAQQALLERAESLEKTGTTP